MKKKDAKPHKLVDAYEYMLAHVRAVVDKETVHDAINQAKETLLEVGQLTHDEVEMVGKHLMRDLAGAAHFLHETETGLVNWIKFDWELIEARLWDNFSAVADKTLLEQQALQFRLMRGPIYNSGEVIVFGSLQCDQCGEVLNFEEVSQIPPCSECGATEFSRISQQH